jgi:hypothetical protein
MFSWNLTAGVTPGPGQTLSKSYVKEAGGMASLHEAIPANATNVLMTVALDVSAMKAFYLLSDVACTIKTNSSGSPADTITVAAGVPMLWDVAHEGALPNPFGTDVTAFYVTTASTVGGTLSFYALSDPTP